MQKGLPPKPEAETKLKVTAAESVLSGCGGKTVNPNASDNVRLRLGFCTGKPYCQWSSEEYNGWQKLDTKLSKNKLD